MAVLGRGKKQTIFIKVDQEKKLPLVSESLLIIALLTLVDLGCHPFRFVVYGFGQKRDLRKV